ncbi:MAG: NAD-dependent epimerase/dehydratase family protein [Parvularculaceae bacterium]|nr:NAD-dependent epimerase/dehydratase family protein [Parvularculaceae bacterium]
MTLRVGFLGAGYIAKWHADALKRVPNVALVGVADLSRNAAESFARMTGATAYDSLDALLGAGVDCVHVLTPPNAHFDPVRRILSAGVAAFVEKPFVLTSTDARALSDLAAEKGVALGVNHNFLMLPSYERLKADLASGTLGPIDSLQANWRLPLPPLRSGPYGLWMLREPQNILFELGPHLFSFAADILGDFEPKDVLARYPVEIPGGVVHHQAWRIAGLSGETAVTLDLSLIEGQEDRSLELRCVGGLVRYDFGFDSYDKRTPVRGDIVLGPFASQFAAAASTARQAFLNAGRQAASFNMLAPYGLSITRACQSFYASVASRTPVDPRLSSELATRVIAMIETAARMAVARPSPARRSSAVAAPQSTSTMLVIGGAGFIGRALTTALADAGYAVRVYSRGRPPGLERPDGRVTVRSGSLHSEADLLAAMEGVEGVFHLARADEKTWEGYLANDVAVSRLIGECCVKAGVNRLVYTGTIASFDATRPDQVVDHTTPLDPQLDRRHLYARSKGTCEKVLADIARTKGLNLVIARPGIVIGRGGPLQHWGIAMWRGATACKMWGRGDNIMPFVDVDDCADGLVRAMTTPSVDGRAFFLVGEPMLTSRDYFDEIRRAYGVAIDARPTPIWRYFAVDWIKHALKRALLRKKDLEKPTLHDWRNRAAYSRYDNHAAKEALGWRPAATRSEFVARAIAGANLFGVPPRTLETGPTTMKPAEVRPAVAETDA